MAAKDLNIRLGLIFDEKSLARVESRLRRSGEKLSRIGTDLSLSLSAPLAAFGAVSIKAAGDLESLTLALQSQLGSAEAAKKELAALTEAAKNPGIGLEEAVRASVRLQGVGISADEARQTILQLGNALASTGGTAEDLERVTRQFAQMTSKGRVLQEDISIISESMPAISGLMQKAFGTTNVDAIRNMGVGGKEFVLAITQAAQELPRVAGGIKNSIGNTLDSLKQSLAKVGFAINNTFDIAGAAESFGNFVVGIAEGFANLNPVLQNVVLGMGGLLVAAGPVAKLIGTIETTSALLVGTWEFLVKNSKRLATAIETAVVSLINLQTVSKAFIGVGLVAAIAGLAYVFGAFNKELSANEKAQEAVNQLERDAKKSIAGEKVEVDRLIEVINSEVTSREAKARALDKLKAISPQYFGQLREENGLVVGLKSAYDSYIDSLLKSARAAAAREKLVEIERQLLDIEDNRLNKIKEAASVSAFLTGSTQTGLQNETALYQKQISELEAKRNALAGVLAENEPLTESTSAATQEGAKFASGLKEQSKQGKILAEVLSDINNERERQNLLGAKDIIAEAEAIEGGIKKLLDAGFTPASKAIQNLKGQLKGLFGEKPANFEEAPFIPTPDKLKSETATTPSPKAIEDNTNKVKSFAQALGEVNVAFQESAIGFNDAFSQVATLVQTQGSLMQQTFFGIATAMQEAASQGAGSLSELASAAVSAAAKIVRAWIQQGVAAAVARALSSLPFPANLAAGAVAGSLAAALFTKGLNKIGLKGFARGTQFAPGGLALVGEQGPELMNIPRGAQIASNSRTNRLLDGAGGNMNVSGEFTVRGTDLVLVIDRVNSKNKRIR